MWKTDTGFCAHVHTHELVAYHVHAKNVLACHCIEKGRVLFKIKCLSIRYIATQEHL